MSGNGVDDLEALLAQKLAACEDFLSSTRQLRRALEEDDGDGTDRLLARRAGSIAIVERLDRKIDRCRQGVWAAGLSLDLPHLDTLSARIGETIRAMALENGNCAAAAGSRRDTLKEALRATNRTKTGLQGYGDTALQGPRFLNLQT